MYNHSRCCESLVARALTLWNTTWHFLAELTEDQRLSKLGRLNYQGAPDKVQTKWWDAYSFWSCVPFPFRAQVRRGKHCSFAAKRKRKKKALQTVGSEDQWHRSSIDLYKSWALREACWRLCSSASVLLQEQQGSRCQALLAFLSAWIPDCPGSWWPFLTHV